MTSAYELNVFDKSKLEQLPSTLQAELKLITREKFRLLCASVSRHRHFDFFGLPREIRDMVLGFLFETRYNRVVPASSASKLLDGIEILRTNKALHQEATAALHKINTVVWTFNEKLCLPSASSKQYQYANSLTAFNKIELNITMHDIYVDSKSDDESGPNGIMKKMLDTIEAAVHHKTAPSEMWVKVNFGVVYPEIDYDLLDDFETRFSKEELGSGAYVKRQLQEPYLAGFVRLQLQNMLSNHDHAWMRSANVNVQTNVDNENFENGTAWLRHHDKLAVFKNPANRLMGKVEPQPIEWRHFLESVRFIFYYSDHVNTLVEDIADVPDDEFWP